MSSLTKAISVLVVLVLVAGGVYFWSQGKNGAGGQADNSLTIQFGNNSYDALKLVELSPAGANTFLTIPLTEGKLGAGEFYAHAIDGGKMTCTYDLRATKENGKTAKFNNVNLCDQTFYHFEDVGYE